MFSTLKIMFGKKRLGPSYPERPAINDKGESNISDMYIIGDVSGTALIKLALNQGVQTAQLITQKIKTEKPTQADYSVIVVGIGCAGLGALQQLKSQKVSCLGLDSGRSIQTIRNFTKNKPLYLEPEEIPFEGDWHLQEGTKEELIEQIDKVIINENLPIKEYEKITNIQKSGKVFTVSTIKGSYTANYVIVAIGKSGNPRKTGVPGETENAEKIFHSLADPDIYQEEHILIYGGGDVALEAAIALAPQNKVTLATIDKALTFPKKRNIDKLMELNKKGLLQLRLNTQLQAVGKDHVGIKEGENEVEKIDNKVLFEMIGSELPVPFFRKIKVRLASDWTLARWSGLIFSSLIVYLLYAWKKGYFPFSYGFGIKQLGGILSHPSFWYSLLYTLLMTVFGLKAMKRWNKGGKDKYQTYRYLSLIGFQILSFVGVEITAALFLPRYWWRFYALNNPFPLLFDSFYNWTSTDVSFWRIAFILGAVFMTLVAIPLFVRWHGKRFCSWVCGCGGLAETFGDKWRHLSAKGIRAQKWETVGTLVLFWAALSALVILFVYGGSTHQAGQWHHLYSLVVDFWLVAVIPVALYPFFGGKVWCRFWCPLAKYMQILSKWYGTLQISSNEKCISCTKCSTYCEVGVDVMSFAKNTEAFNNTNSSCIQCGVCVSVCPMNVLSFDNNARQEEPKN